MPFRTSKKTKKSPQGRTNLANKRSPANKSPIASNLLLARDKDRHRTGRRISSRHATTSRIKPTALVNKTDNSKINSNRTTDNNRATGNSKARETGPNRIAPPKNEQHKINAIPALATNGIVTTATPSAPATATITLDQQNATTKTIVPAAFPNQSFASVSDANMPSAFHAATIAASTTAATGLFTMTRGPRNGVTTMISTWTTSMVTTT
jgi:hypothetical protein